MYLEILTKTNENETFMHFINISDEEEMLEDIQLFINHITTFRGQKIIELKKRKTRLTNW